MYSTIGSGTASQPQYRDAAGASTKHWLIDLLQLVRILLLLLLRLVKVSVVVGAVVLI
jgi:hypothetical protein